jgi:DNA (cytosine-5)-methyltransferase 1
VLDFLEIPRFSVDLAANHKNRVCDHFFDEEENSLDDGWAWQDHIATYEWAWLNPPYANIAPWVQKAANSKPFLSNYSGIAMLVPASVGANWWRDYVDGQAHVRFLNGRLTFVGHTAPYPKDLALLLYSLSVSYKPGYHVWDWRNNDT